MFSVKIASLMAKNHESRQFCEKLNIKKKKKKEKVHPSFSYIHVRWYCCALLNILNIL